MEETLFNKSNLPNTLDPSTGWTESQYIQLKHQLIAYKYMIRNISVPNEVLDKIRSYESDEWLKIREQANKKNCENLEKKFKNHDLVTI